MQAVDPNKDQSYFLFPITSEALSKTLFPLGGMTKPEVRAHGERLGLVTAKKKESQDVCFIPDGNYANFLTGHNKDSLPDGSGEIVTREGMLLVVTMVLEVYHWAKTWIGCGYGETLCYHIPQNKRLLLETTNTSKVMHLLVRVNWFREPKREADGRIRHRGTLWDVIL